jgi:hypothetical protein
MYYVCFLLNEARIEFVILGSGSEEKIKSLNGLIFCGRRFSDT